MSARVSLTEERPKRSFPDVDALVNSKRSKVIHSSESPRANGKLTSPLRFVRKRIREYEGSDDDYLSDEEAVENVPSKSRKFTRPCACDDCECSEVEAEVQTLLISPKRSPISIKPPSALFGAASMSQYFGQLSPLSCGSERSFDDSGIQAPVPVILKKPKQKPLRITKEMYDYDRVKRVERLKRIFGIPVITPPTSPSTPFQNSTL